MGLHLIVNIPYYCHTIDLHFHQFWSSTSTGSDTFHFQFHVYAVYMTKPRMLYIIINQASYVEYDQSFFVIYDQGFYVCMLYTTKPHMLYITSYVVYNQARWSSSPFLRLRWLPRAPSCSRPSPNNTVQQTSKKQNKKSNTKNYERNY